jgi:hypothetical protein
MNRLADDHSRSSRGGNPRYTIGSLLAFIAGMAVMLGILLPFVRTSPSPVKAPPSHAGMATASVTPKNCAACHAGAPSPAPARQPPHPFGLE